MHELDLFIEKKAKEFNKPSEQYRTDEYIKEQSEIVSIRYYLTNTKGEERKKLIKKTKKLKLELLKAPIKLQTDKKIRYI